MPATHAQPPHRSTHCRGALLVILVSLCHLAPVSIAQAAINSVASSLPLRNVLIEVRQVQSASDQRTQTQGSASLQVDGHGAIGGGAQLQAQQGQRQTADTAVQKILVLNGRSARISLGTRVPLRVVNTYVRNGVLVAVPGSMVIEVGTGFAATPRWNGSDPMELELTAVQSSGTGGVTSRSGVMPTTQETVSVVVAPLGQWVTVAQSDTQTNGQSATLGTTLAGNAQWSGQANSEVQVRLTLP